MTDAEQKRFEPMLNAIRGRDGEIIPTAEAIRRVASEHPDRSEVEKYRLAQAATLLDVYERAKDDGGIPQLTDSGPGRTSGPFPFRRVDPMASSSEERRLLEAVAYHEAGHAVAALEFRHAIHSVTIVPDPEAGTLGQVRRPKRYQPSFMPEVYDLDDARFQTACIREILISLAGPAEERYTGRWNSIGAGSDLAFVEDLVERVSGEGEGKPFLDWLTARARNLIAHRNNWVKVEGLARALLVTPTLSNWEAKEACRLAFIASLPEDLRVQAANLP